MGRAPHIEGKDSINALVTHKSSHPQTTHLYTHMHAHTVPPPHMGWGGGLKKVDVELSPPIGLLLYTSNELCTLPNEDILGFRVEELCAQLVSAVIISPFPPHPPPADDLSFHQRPRKPSAD